MDDAHRRLVGQQIENGLAEQVPECPVPLQIARPVKTTSELAIGSLELECLDNSELLPGVDVIIGTGQTKEMNTIKSIMKGEDEFVRRANFVSPKILMGCTEPHHNCTLLWNLC